MAKDMIPVTQEARAFDRLHALARKGYVADIGAEAPRGGIALRHLGKAPDLMLLPDGTVEELDVRRPWHKRAIEDLRPIPAAKDSDEVRFLQFLDTVPRPKWRDRTRPWRKKYLYVPGILLAFWGLLLLFSLILFSGA